MTRSDPHPPHARAPASDAACTACGHEPPPRRIDWRYIADELRHGVFSVERGLLHTVAALLLRPGRLLRDYVDGRRGAYVKPLWLLVTTAALVTLVHRYVPGLGAMDQFSAGAQAAAGEGGAEALVRTYQALFAWMYANLAAATLLLLPLEAALLRLAFWRVRGLNYPEWLTMTAYLTSQTFLVWTVGIALRGVVPDAEAWALPAAIGWNVASLVLVFDARAWWISLLQAVVGLTLFMIASMLVFVAAVIVLVQAGGL